MKCSWICILLMLFALGGTLCYAQRGQPSRTNNVFLDAIISGDVQKVGQLLSEDPNLVSTVDTRGKATYRPALHLAVMYGHSDIVELLLSKGAKANLRDRYGVSPLEVAAKRGHANVVAPLISYGGDINGEQHEFRRPPLCEASNGEVAEALIANGADVNWRDKLEITPLHFVAKDGATEAAKVLIKHGAKVDARNKWGETPLHWAVRRGNKDMAELLLAAGADINARDGRGLTALNRAVREDRTVDEKARKAAGRLLVSRGAEYTISDVAWLGDVERVCELLENDPALASTGASGLRESLWIAVLAGETEVVEVLLAHGADPNVTSRFGLPSLHLAAALGNKAIVRLLLENGADVNRQGENGESALHWAAARGHSDIVQLLLQAGAHVNPRASEARSGIDVLPPEDFDALHYWLRYLSDSEKQKQVMAAGRGLQIAGPIRAVFAAGDTALHSAAQWGHAEIVELLLSNGAAVNAANRCKQVPLHYASAFRHRDITEALIKAGADVNAKEKNGYTPLTLACWPKSTPLNDVAQLLIQKGAK